MSVCNYSTLSFIIFMFLVKSRVFVHSLVSIKSILSFVSKLATFHVQMYEMGGEGRVGGKKGVFFHKTVLCCGF